MSLFNVSAARSGEYFIVGQILNKSPRYSGPQVNSRLTNQRTTGNDMGLFSADERLMTVDMNFCTLTKYIVIFPTR